MRRWARRQASGPAAPPADPVLAEICRPLIDQARDNVRTARVMKVGGAIIGLAAGFNVVRSGVHIDVKSAVSVLELVGAGFAYVAGRRNVHTAQLWLENALASAREGRRAGTRLAVAAASVQLRDIVAGAGLDPGQFTSAQFAGAPAESDPGDGAATEGAKILPFTPRSEVPPSDN